MNKLSLAALMLALSTLSLVGCAAPAMDDDATEAEGDTSSLIINGKTDQAHPAVVAIQWNIAHADGTNGVATCTGTVIGPKTILTAGHCVKPSDDTDEYSNYKVAFGTDFTQANAVIAGVEAIPHPSYDPSVFGNNDVGIIVLETATTVKPLRIAQVITNMTGKTVTHVGFGKTDASGKTKNHTKQTVDLPVTMQTAHVLQTGNGKSGICSGDSGGPMLSVNGQTKETLIVGVHSYVDNVKTCLGKGYSTRTDTVKDFVLAHIK